MASLRNKRALDIVGEGPSLAAPHPEDLAAVVNSSPCILWTSDVEGVENSDSGGVMGLRWAPRVLNEVAAQHVLPLDIAPGSNFFEAWRDSRHRGDDRQMWDTALNALVSGAPGYDQVFRCFDRLGAEHWLHEAVRITPVAPGRWYVVGVATDVTPHWPTTENHRRVSQELDNAVRNQRHSAAVLDLILDSVPIAIALLSREGTFVRVNREFCRLTALSDATLAGEPVSRWLDSQLSTALSDGLASILASGKPLAGLELQMDQPGGLRTWLLAMHPISLGGDEITAVNVLLQDVTDLRHAQEARIAQQVAEAANAAKDHFLAMLSHELRMPLTPVLALAGVLEEDRRIPEECRQDLTVIRQNTELEARLIDDLLDLTRIARGKLVLSPEEADLHEVVQRTLGVYRAQLDSRSLVCEVNLRATRTTADVDPARIQQVITNLLSNAMKFTPAGGRVTITSDDDTLRGGPAIRLTVSDTGIGIDAASIERIFHPFEQGLELHDQQRQAGLGLGLAISRLLVEKHGGAIWASSAGVNRGAAFHVVLPVHSENAPPVASVSMIAQAAATARVLLVEDHLDTARVLSRLLNRIGYRTTTAGSVKEALAQLSGNRFDILVSDLGLPDGSGRDIVRQRPYPIPAIALSGFGSPHDVAEALEAGFAQHLTKPVTLPQLHRTIAACLEDAKGGGRPDVTDRPLPDQH